MTNAEVYEIIDREWQDLVESTSEGLGRKELVFKQDRARMLAPPILFAELEDVRSTWSELIETIDLERHASRFITPAWTIKDLAAHVSSWATELRSQIEKAAREESFDYIIPFALSVIGPNEWNQVEVEKRRSKSVAAVLEEYESETLRMQDLVLSLPGDSLRAERKFPLAPTGDPSALWRGNIAQIALLKCSHDRWHMERVRQWRSMAAKASANSENS